MELLLWMLVTTSILAVGALIGDHIIPAIVTIFRGEPKPKQRIDYAEKAWMKALSSYQQ